MIRRVTGIIGPGSKVSQVITELFPMINVEAPPAELLFLGDIFTCFEGGRVAGVAGQFSQAQLFNPPDSNALMSITKIIMTTDTPSSSDWNWGLLPVVFAGAPVGQANFTDARQRFPNQPIGQVRQRNQVAVGVRTGRARTKVDVPFELSNENGIAVLEPGTGFEIEAGLTDHALIYTFYWRERVAEASELNV